MSKGGSRGPEVKKKKEEMMLKTRKWKKEAISKKKHKFLVHFNIKT
jgi:hypothetical protein